MQRSSNGSWIDRNKNRIVDMENLWGSQSPYGEDLNVCTGFFAKDHKYFVQWSFCLRSNFLIYIFSTFLLTLESEIHKNNFTKHYSLFFGNYKLGIKFPYASN